MKRSTASFLLIVLMIAIALLDIMVEGSQWVLQVIPLCAVAVLYGYPGLLLAFTYLVVLLCVLALVGVQLLFSTWHIFVVALVPVCTAWVHAQRLHRINLEQMQRRLLQGMRDGVILSGPDHVVHLVNPAACTLLCLPSAFAEREAALAALGILCHWEECLTFRDVITREYLLEDRVLQVTATPVFENAHVMGLVTTIVDFTAERQLSTMREEFVAIISHELRNPLTSINGFAELLLVQEMSEGLQRYVRTIKRNSDRMLRLVHDLLQMKTFELGSFHLHTQLVDIGELLRHVCDGMKPAVIGEEITLQLLCPETPVWGDYDIDRLSQVFANLLDNAVKFSPRGGAVTVSVARESETVTVEVRDQGEGIPAPELERIFEKYYQVTSGTVARRGSGLGLAISHSLVTSHRGRIWATSAMGKGTSFWVQLPCRSVQRAIEMPGFAAEEPLLMVAESSPAYELSPPAGREGRTP